MRDSDNAVKILCSGKWPSTQVTSDYSDTLFCLPDFHPERALAHWQRLLDANADGHLYNGDLFRLESWEAADDCLRLCLSRTCYRDQLYGNAHVAELVESHGERALAWGLGVSAALVTADGMTPIAKRSSSTAEGANKLCIIGGHAHPSRHLHNGNAELFQAIADEVIAEVSLAPHEFAVACCLGIVLATHTRKPDIVFLVETEVAMADLAARAKTSEEAFEFEEVFGIPSSSHELQHYIVQNRTELTPAAIGTLMLLMNTMRKNSN